MRQDHVVPKKRLLATALLLALAQPVFAQYAGQQAPAQEEE